MKYCVFIFFWFNLSSFANAEELRVAVAANFTSAAKEIGKAFEQNTDHTVLFSFGSTGQLYAQISQFAPFDIFLAADQVRPKKAVTDGFAVPGSRFTYAKGKIVLYSVDQSLIKNNTILKQNKFSKIAIANPVTAPYGFAAVEVLQHLQVHEDLKNKIVFGNNIAQTYQFVHTENAELGFIALSQVVAHKSGSRWIVPEELYSKIAQDVVLLKYGSENPAAHAFLKFIKEPAAQKIIDQYGYGNDG